MQMKNNRITLICGILTTVTASAGMLLAAPPVDPATATTNRAMTGPNRIGLYGTVRNSEKETAEYIAQCKANGIGVLLPSLSGGGTVIWKTDKAQYYPALKAVLDAGYDPLADLIKQAHAAGIEVVPSVAVGPGGKILDGHPEWETHDRLGRPSSATVTPSISFAVPAARQAKIAVLMDLVTGYDVDGVLLDYCRYPENSSSPEAKYGFYGYDKPLIDACQSIYGFDPRKVPIDSPEWTRFNNLRSDTVTLFVKEFRDAVKATGKSVRVDGFGDTDPNLEARMCGRNWGAWGREGLIDTFYLATYQEKAGQMAGVIKTARDALGPNVRLVAAIAPFNNFVTTDEQLVSIAKAQLTGGADGVWIYRDDYLETSKLWNGVKMANAFAVEQGTGQGE
jgi:uncharacterized lipoprotein YddW (UPF0748 family)